MEENLYRCKICGKTYKTEKGVQRHTNLAHPHTEPAKLEFWKKAVSGVAAFCIAFIQMAISIIEIRLANPGYVFTNTLPFTAGALVLAYVYYYIFTDYFTNKMSGYATLGTILLIFLGGWVAAIVFFLLVLIGTKIGGNQQLSNKMIVYYGVMSLVIAGLIWYLLGI